jgi:GDP-mannose 6-dehydrogenase
MRPRRRHHLGIYGLAFKENTDDLRESPVVALVEHLIGKGRDVRIFDPHISLSSIYGSNLNFVMSSIPHIGRLMCADLDELLRWTDGLVIAQEPSPEAAAQIQATGIPQLRIHRPAPQKAAAGGAL